MKLRLPTAVVATLVALCGIGVASVFLPWAVINLLGAEIPFSGYRAWNGQASALAFAVLAAVCVGHAVRPQLPRTVPLAFAVVVGLSVLALALGPYLLSGPATVSFDGGPRHAIPEAIGVGKWLAGATGAGLVLVAGGAWWWERRTRARVAEPTAEADGGRDPGST